MRIKSGVGLRRSVSLVLSRRYMLPLATVSAIVLAVFVASE